MDYVKCMHVSEFTLGNITSNLSTSFLSNISLSFGAQCPCVQCTFSLARVDKLILGWVKMV